MFGLRGGCDHEPLARSAAEVGAADIDNRPDIHEMGQTGKPLRGQPGVRDDVPHVLDLRLSADLETFD